MIAGGTLLVIHDDVAVFIEGDRGVANFNDPAVTADHVADLNRLQEFNGVDGNGDRASHRHFFGQDRPGNIHL